jgi:hypothetical protein
MTLFLDSTAIDTWLTCRESYRQRYVENRVAAYPQLALAFGHSVHVAVEAFWKGATYEAALKLAAEDMCRLDENLLTPPDQQKWREMALMLCDLVACYFDGVEYEAGAEVEREWQIPYLFKDCMHETVVTLRGKIDRYHCGVLTDVKTASEIGRTWYSDYRSTLLRTFQFGLYDWYLRTAAVRGGFTVSGGIERTTPECTATDKSVEYPCAVKVECLVKPYKGKPARLEVFDLPEILVYRKRFDQQLAWVVTEIARYHEAYLEQRPWPMAGSQICQGKFSACPYLKGCNSGWTPKILEGYTERKEHLVCLGAKP